MFPPKRGFFASGVSSGLLWKLYIQLSIEDKDSINWLIIVPTDLLDFLRDQRQHANILHGLNKFVFTCSV